MEGVFTAGDGDLSIVYQAAAHLWGTWGATYTEGVDPEDFEEDRALGFVGDVGDTGGELASRMWVRADVSTDQDAQTSTVPTIFRDARERTSGDVVVTRDISGPGLGGLVPYVDFRHGDEMGTVIGSKVVPLPVSAIQFITDVSSGRDYIVTVGKGLLGNTTELDLRNAELEAQIRAETFRREQEAARLREQAETDRQQTSLIKGQQSTLSSQQSTLSSQQSTLKSQTVQLRDHSAEIVEWSEDMAKNSNIIRMILNLLEAQESVWLEVADLFESYHNSSGNLRTYVEIYQTTISSMQAQHQGVSKLPPPPQIV